MSTFLSSGSLKFCSYTHLTSAPLLLSSFVVLLYQGCVPGVPSRGAHQPATSAIPLGQRRLLDWLPWRMWGSLSDPVYVNLVSVTIFHRSHPTWQGWFEGLLPELQIVLGFPFNWSGGDPSVPLDLMPDSDLSVFVTSPSHCSFPFIFPGGRSRSYVGNLKTKKKKKNRGSIPCKPESNACLNPSSSVLVYAVESNPLAPVNSEVSWGLC